MSGVDAEVIHPGQVEQAEVVIEAAGHHVRRQGLTWFSIVNVRSRLDLTILIDGGSGLACVACPGRPPGRGAVAVRPSGDSVPPIEHPECPESVPAARRAHTGLKIEVDAARMDAVEQPPAVGL